mmetsp:Transcript_11209/g.27550  ORF Transcript_11209/g.27550 Transcript_11209/m.27550 type:complete len:251 (+) Transcript_11209:611-1363(+)
MKTLVIMKVAIQFSFRLSGIRLVITIRAGIELVALVIPPRVGTVLGPIPHANPAKMVLAAGAGHVVTALIFFNARRAFWTWLRICKDPIGRFGLVTAFLLPHGKILARDRGVWFFSTLEAEASFTLVALSNTNTICKYTARTRGEGNLLAPWSWTPTGHAVCFHKRFELVTYKLGEEIRRCPRDLLLSDDFVAPRLGASFVHAEWSFFKGIVNKSIPASFTELVPTWHAHHFARFKAIFVHAYFTVSEFR